MKCKIIRDDMEVSYGMSAAFVSENAEARIVTRSGRKRPVLFWKVGTVLDHPEAHYLVRQGCAIPADAECTERCVMTQEQTLAAQAAYSRLAAGIELGDAALYDAGIISGYEDDGSYKPGPNAAAHPEVFAVEEPEDEDDDDE